MVIIAKLEPDYKNNMLKKLRKDEKLGKWR